MTTFGRFSKSVTARILSPEVLVSAKRLKDSDDVKFESPIQPHTSTLGGFFFANVESRISDSRTDSSTFHDADACSIGAAASSINCRDGSGSRASTGPKPT
jgi:hypothetical protein